MSEKRYETKTLRLGLNKKQLNRHIEAGWEVTSSSGGAIGTGQTVTLRRALEDPATVATTPRPDTTAINLPQDEPFSLARYVFEKGYAAKRKAEKEARA